MKRTFPFALTVAAALAAAGPLAVLPGTALAQHDAVYGWELMTEDEREAYKAELANAASEQERELIRAAHREKMEARARDQGVELRDPDNPQARQ